VRLWDERGNSGEFLAATGRWKDYMTACHIKRGDLVVVKRWHRDEKVADLGIAITVEEVNVVGGYEAPGQQPGVRVWFNCDRGFDWYWSDQVEVV